MVDIYSKRHLLAKVHHRLSTNGARLGDRRVARLHLLRYVRHEKVTDVFPAESVQRGRPGCPPKPVRSSRGQS
jgi:hypothetical protein